MLARSIAVTNPGATVVIVNSDFLYSTNPGA